MSPKHLILPISLVSLLAIATGCGASREVEVKGEISAAQGLTVDGKIALEFYDLVGEGADRKRTRVEQVTLDKIGAFTQKIQLEGARLAVRAIADKDGNKACSAGEPWAEAEAAVKDDDTVEPVRLTLSAQPCPEAK